MKKTSGVARGFFDNLRDHPETSFELPLFVNQFSEAADMR